MQTRYLILDNKNNLSLYQLVFLVRGKSRSSRFSHKCVSDHMVTDELNGTQQSSPCIKGSGFNQIKFINLFINQKKFL